MPNFTQVSVIIDGIDRGRAKAAINSYMIGLEKATTIELFDLGSALIGEIVSCRLSNGRIDFKKGDGTMIHGQFTTIDPASRQFTFDVSGPI